MMVTTYNKQFLLYSLCLFFCLIFGAQDAIGQESSFRIDKIKADVKNLRIKLDVVACNENGGLLIPVSNRQDDLNRIELSMSKPGGGSTSLTVEHIEAIANYSEEDSIKVDGQMKVLFLLDMSGSMKPKDGENRLEKAKSAIKEIFMSGSLDGMDVELATFHNTISVSRSLRKDNIHDRIDPIDIPAEDVWKLHTDLYRAIKEKTDELSTFNGNKVLFILTDGKDESNKVPIYKYHKRKNPKPLTRISENEIIRHIESLDSTFQIFPVGIGSGAKKEFLESVSAATKSDSDFYQFDVVPKDIGKSVFKAVCGLKPNLRITFMPDENDAVFANEKREFTLNYYNDPENRSNPYIANRSAVLGGSAGKVDLRPSFADSGNPISLSVIIYGVIILSLLLVSLIGLVPWMSDRKFKREYVRKYYQVKKENVRQKDPYSLQEYKDQDDVVVSKDGKLMLLETWKYLKNKGEGEITKDFADLFSSHPGEDFFSQKGIYKRLNWLWFGAFGGFIACLLLMLFTNIPLIAGDNMFRNFLTGIFDQTNDYATPIYNQTFIGLSLGIGVVMMLAIVEEYGQSRKFSFGRLFLRVLYGGMMGALIFFGESILTTTVLNNPFIGGLFGWTLFGTALGFTVTLFSSIEIISGIRGGFIAGIIGFIIYFLLGFADNFLSPKIAQLIGFLVYGGVLGVVIDSVVARYEAFELLYLSPKSYSGMKKPISKWLKSSDIDYIYIGQDPSSEIYIKWDDKSARNRNARLSYEKNMVYIEAVEGEVLVNSRPARNKTVLNNGDEIQLGSESVSRFRFIAKDTADKGGDFSKGGKGGFSVSRNTGAKRKVLTVKDKERRGKITINRRNPIK